jgi:serine/threonine protein phosphatase 1
MTEGWKPVLKLEKNTNGRDFVCGDIHGCFDKVVTAMAENNLDTSKDRLFCVGDLIDRGPKSELALEYLEKTWFYPVLGNHEHLFFMGNVESDDSENFLRNHVRNGGGWAYKQTAEFRKKLVHAIDKMPLIIQVGDTLILHASLPNLENLEPIEKFPFQFMEEILWERPREARDVKIQGINRVYVGHSIVPEPVTQGKTINIDTGAFLTKDKYGRDGKLTMIEIEKE